MEFDNDAPSLEPTLQRNFKGHKKSITSLHFSPNESQIATGSLDNSVLLWHIKGSVRSYRFQGHNEPVMDVTFSPTGRYMASASQDKTVRLWVPTVVGSTAVFKAHSQTVRSVQFSSDGSKILTASDDKVLKLWHTPNHKFISSFVGHTNWVRCARITDDSSVIASCSDDKTVKLWNTETSQNIHTYRVQKGYGLNVAWNPSGCFVAVATSEGNVKLYDIRTHSLVQYYDVHKEAVNRASFHPSGKYIISASKDGNMKILDLLEGRPLFTLRGHVGGVNAASFSPTGDLIASAGEDKLVFVWKTNFTEIEDIGKENMPQSQQVASTTSKRSASKLQDGNIWYKCYQGSHYPVANFVFLDGHDETDKSTDSTRRSNTKSGTVRTTSKHFVSTPIRTTLGSTIEPPPFNMSDTSHIPRTPPSPQTFTIPSVLNFEQNQLFGMISLKEDDVCYTSGTIEWVGKKRNFPLNSGFKILHGNTNSRLGEPMLKKARHNLTYSIGNKDCDCADVLPTVSAIVDHLNALHEAVDIVDLRLNNLEEVVNEE